MREEEKDGGEASLLADPSVTLGVAMAEMAEYMVRKGSVPRSYYQPER